MSTSAKIDVFCPQCRAKLAVPVAALGKSGKCPHCQNVFPLAMPAQRPAAAAASPLTPLSPATPSLLTPLARAPHAAPAMAANVLDPLDSPDLMPLSDAGLTPLPASNQFSFAASGNPFAAPAPRDEYALQPAAPSPYAPAMTLPSNASLAREHLAAASASYEEAKQRKYYSNDGEGWGLNAGIGGGALLMLIAIVWFFGILFFTEGRRFPIYAPIMFIVGLIAFFKGIFDNFSE